MSIKNENRGKVYVIIIKIWVRTLIVLTHFIFYLNDLILLN